MSKKLTPWFDDYTRPARVGYYDAKWLMAWPKRRLYWDGLNWLKERYGSIEGLQQYYWRGLAKKP